MHACLHVEDIEPSGVSSLLSSRGSRNQTQVFSLGDKHLSLLSHLEGTQRFSECLLCWT